MIKLINLFIISFVVLTSYTKAQEGEKEYSLFKSKTYVKNPLELRDPFRRKLTRKKNPSQSMQASLQGIYTNTSGSLENKPLDSIKIIGIVLGAQRRAMARVIGEANQPGSTSPNTYYIKEGMKIGANGAEVKAILPGGIVLVEKIRNVYDQDEYLETVIPVSND